MNENRIRSVFPDSDIGFPDTYQSFTFPSSADRPPARDGRTFYNTKNLALETYQNGKWVSLGTIGVSPTDGPQAPLSELLKAGSNVQLETLENGQIRINVPSVGDYTVGENIGNGQGSVYRGKEGTRLLLRRFRSANEYLKIQTDDEAVVFTMADPGETNIGRGLGKGVSVYAGKNGSELLFLNLIGSDSIEVVRDDGDIRFRVGPDLVVPGHIGLGLPRGSGGPSEEGRIRFNPIMNRYEVGFSSGWQILSTDEGTFLPLTGGVVQTLVVEHDLGVLGDLHMVRGTIRGGQDEVLINLEDAKMISGLTGTIDGFRFPEIAGTVNTLNQLDPGILIRTSAKEFETIQLSGIGSISINKNYEIGLSENPTLPGTGSVLLPTGPSMTRDGRIGAIRYNQAGYFEGCLPSGWQTFASIGSETFNDLRVLGDVNIGGRLNGRDIAADIEMLGRLQSIRGLAFSGPDGWVSAQIAADPKRLGIHVSDSGSQILIGIDSELIINTLLGQIDHTLVRADSVVAGRTIDGRNLIRDGATIDALNQLGSGLIVHSESGYAVRTITGSAMPKGMGIGVENPDGSGEIRVSLRLDSLPVVKTVADTDMIVLETADGNKKISFSDFIAEMMKRFGP